MSPSLDSRATPTSRCSSDAEALVRELQGRGWLVVTAIEQDAAGRLATVRLAFANADVRGAVVDLLFASSGIEPEIMGRGARDDFPVFRSLPGPDTQIVIEKLP